MLEKEGERELFSSWMSTGNIESFGRRLTAYSSEASRYEEIFRDA